MGIETDFDIAIIGGGLAGLSLAIQLADAGKRTALFEKETYPFHKVCGEYISLESWNFLESLGVPLNSMKLPIIKHLQVSSSGGTILSTQLPLGGFGISRYKLDSTLKDICVAKGVRLFEQCKVENVVFDENHFAIKTSTGQFISKVCCGCFGKRSNIDIQLKRSFISKKNNKLNNYIGIKYHIKTSHKADTIALHNFENGYCGISQIEDGKHCLCYLTTAANLKNNKNSIQLLEEKVLSKNQYLKEIFSSAEILYEQPVTISQISFDKKTLIENNMLMLGDAAGMITPLCGNGMSMALHSSNLIAIAIVPFLNGNISRSEMNDQYARNWKKLFAKRLRTGRLIQSMFGKSQVTNLFIKVMKRLPFITHWLIKQTHGRPF